MDIKRGNCKSANSIIMLTPINISTDFSLSPYGNEYHSGISLQNREALYLHSYKQYILNASGKHCIGQFLIFVSLSQYFICLSAFFYCNIISY